MADKELPEHAGWANYPTFIVYWWLPKDEARYEKACSVAADGPKALQAWVESQVVPEKVGMGAGMPTDLTADVLRWALSHVDWKTIAKLLISAAADDDDEDEDLW